MKQLLITFALLALLTGCSLPEAKVVSSIPTNSSAVQPKKSASFQASTTLPKQEEPTTYERETISKNLVSLTSEICINNTSDEAQAKDCCDCLSGADGATIKTCRDTVAKHDFSLNSGFITFTVHSRQRGFQHIYCRREPAGLQTIM